MKLFLISTLFLQLSSSKMIYPNIFDMEDYTRCTDTDGNFCNVNIELAFNRTELQQFGQNFEINYNRSKIHRGICVPTYLSGDFRRVYVANKLATELKPYQVNWTVISMDCEEVTEIFSSVQILASILIVIYASFVVYATYKDFYDQKTVNKSWYQYFSIRHNFRVMLDKKDPDFRKLCCIQGFRTYHTVMVILCHALLCWSRLYIKNPSYMEELVRSWFAQLLTSYFMLIVQPFFLISSWILTNRILEINRRYGYFSLDDIACMFINRLIRFCPVLLIAIFGAMIYLPILCNGPMNFELFNIMNEGCKRHWWLTILQISNLSSFSEMCNAILWSLSIDTQYYLLNMMILYIIIRYKWSLIKTLLAALMLFYLRNTWTFYSNNYPALSKITVEGAKTSILFKNLDLDQTYFGFSVNWGSSLIGVLFGYLYYTKKHSLKIENWERILVVLFTILPIVAVCLGVVPFQRLESALIGPLIKPLYSLGIACGIYTISRGILKGLVANIFENKLVVLLGNFTFCTYVFHIVVVISKHIRAKELIEIDRNILILWSLVDIFVSFALGAFITFTIEQPGSYIRIYKPKRLEKNIKRF